MRAKWKETLARDNIGYYSGRLYQFGELTADIVDEAVQEIREVWPNLSCVAVRCSLEA